MASSPNFLLYGANGYTGELIAEEAVRQGLRPILAGRREEAVRPIAERLGLEHRIFALTSPEEIARQLDGVAAVLLAAGPFSATSAPVAEGCLLARKHYLDLTGEIEVFEAIFRRGPEARERGCVFLPGAGFDVVPSDCLAASLQRALPGGVRLELAFAGESRFSKGTAKTMLEGLPRGGAVREGGRIRRVPLGWRTARIPFRDRERTAMTIPWGDVSTAFHSTGIPDIAVYLAVPERAIARARRMRRVAWILGLRPVQAFLKRRIERTVKGPEARLRETGRSHFWGRVTDAAGRSVEGTLETPEGYRLTVLTALECARRVLAGGVPPGAVTPSLAFGPEFITTFAGCDLRIAPVVAPPRPAAAG